MPPSDDAYTIVIFRGATANPFRLRLRKVILKRALLTTMALFVMQAGITVHYVVKMDQVVELNGLREAMDRSRNQTVAFSEAIDDMSQRMLSMQKLHRKLQTMFGLETEPLDGVGVNGQGGEEFPYDAPSSGIPSRVSQNARADESVNRNPDFPPTTLVIKIEKRLAWLDQQMLREQHILAQLQDTAGERADRWAATPSVWPVRGPITSKFGPRRSPFTGKRAFHAGLDIGAALGKEVRAPAKGKVVIAGYDARMGRYIRINHGYGVQTTYGHLSERLVKGGQKVRRGDLIGLVGSTGRFSTGPHLHYEIAIHGKVVNPRQYILD